jgi:hypothetical protein
MKVSMELHYDFYCNLILTSLFIPIECWQHEPDVRPEIRQVILELKKLDNIEPLVVSENFSSKYIETRGKSQPVNEEVIVPSDDDLDIKKYEL